MSFQRLKINKIVNYLLTFCPKKLAHNMIYFEQHKKMGNMINPESYDEKIHWLMIHYYDTSYGKYVDKYTVRQYICNCELEKILIPLIGVYDNNANEIDFSKLPEKFILKATHGSGDKYYSICANKDNYNKEREKKKLNQALCNNFSKISCEYQYAKIKPKIICEELLEPEYGKRMTDYKVVCAYGSAKAILVCTERNNGKDYYSLDWRYLDYVKKEYRSGKVIEKPQILDEMISAAEKISSPFPLARVDFYIVKNKLFFGEITLTPSSGYNYILNEQGQRELGNFIKLPRSESKTEHKKNTDKKNK